MLDFRPICLEDRAWIEPVMQAAAGHGSEFSFVNLYLWGDQRVASVDGTPVFLSNFSGSLTYPWPVGCRDLPGTLELQRQELEATHDREQLRRQGDIVTANLHAITRGQTLLRAEDFYDEDLREIEIPLKPNLSPQQNAARFYKDYARAKHAEQVLTQQIAQGEIEEAYLGGVLEELARAENERDLSEIRAELEAGGYVRPADRRKQVKQQPSKPMHFRSSDGFDIFVGRNNRQNDQLSLKTARRDDLWLHVQKFHGTHVIIACAGVQPPDGTITEAAELAAYYSEARESQNVPVDVTPARCLRKPNGAKPGMVVYDRYRTVLVTPDAALPARLRVE